MNTEDQSYDEFIGRYNSNNIEGAAETVYAVIAIASYDKIRLDPIFKTHAVEILNNLHSKGKTFPTEKDFYEMIASMQSIVLQNKAYDIRQRGN